MILASHAELHGRIAELEKALALAHGQANATPHELLTNTLLYSPRDPKSNVVADQIAESSKRGSGEGLESERPSRAFKRRKSGKDAEHRIHRRQTGDEAGASDDTDSDHTDRDNRESKPYIKSPQADRPDDRLEASLGTLTITQNGEARFVGNAAASSHLTESEGGNAYQTRFSMGFQPRSHGFTHQGAETGLGDFPFAQSLTSDQQSLTLHQLWQRLPAWDSDPLQGLTSGAAYSRDFLQQRHMLGSRIAMGGMDMIKAYWENVDWMYNVVPVR